MDVIFGISILVIVGAYVAADIIDHRKRWKQEDAEDAVFERNRRKRQKEMDRHRIAVARACLMQEAAQIHFVGEVRTRD